MWGSGIIAVVWQVALNDAPEQQWITADYLQHRCYPLQINLSCDYQHQFLASLLAVMMLAANPYAQLPSRLK